LTAAGDITASETVAIHRKYAARCSPTKASWWGRLLVALGVTFYLLYTPVHLATQEHLEGALAALVHELIHHHPHSEASQDEHGEGNGHSPHPASHHELVLTARTQTLSLAAPVLMVAMETAIAICLPEPPPPLPVFEHLRPPGKPPPVPLQPRAPPFA
jgi:hypothetical protein